jgi:hypothetical protein
MKRLLTILSALTFLIVTTSFIVNQDRQYIISITFPETNSSLIKDTLVRYLDIDGHDCGWTTMLINCTNKYHSDNSNFINSNYNCYVCSLPTDIILVKKNNLVTVDTINKSSYHYGCGLKKEFISTLNGDYTLKFIPKNKAYKQFDTTININSKTIIEKGRCMLVTLGNHATTLTYKILSEDKLTKKDKQAVKKILWDFGMEGANDNMQLQIGGDKTIIIKQQK